MNFKMKSTMRYWFSCVVLFLFADLIILQDAQAQRGIREIHQERSLYRNIIGSDIFRYFRKRVYHSRNDTPFFRGTIAIYAFRIPYAPLCIPYAGTQPRGR